MGKNYTTVPEDLEPLTFQINGEEFTMTPQPTAGPLSAIFKSRTNRASDTHNMNRTMLVWMGRGLNPEHEAYGSSKGHENAAEEPVEGCQGCRIEVMLAEGLISYELLIEIASDMLKEVGNRPPTKRTS